MTMANRKTYGRSPVQDIQVTSGAPNLLAHAIRYALVRWYGAS